MSLLPTLTLLGVRIAFLLVQVSHAGRLKSEPACASLENRGSHSVLDIEVGTPGQKFSVVADTGSNNFIVNSCICQEQGICSQNDRCFQGTNKSSTFKIHQSHGQLMGMMITFGSGQVQAVIASDRVAVGQRSAYMDDALLLMVNNALAVSGPFEGILGLGLPGGHAGGSIMQVGSLRKERKARQHQDPVAEHASPKGFLEYAGVKRFSMCFNDGSPGVLRFDPEPAAKPLGAIGQMHWGLGLGGISVGKSFSKVPRTGLDRGAWLCSSDKMDAEQVSSCGAIPDSGTTLIMAPKPHLEQLMTTICDSWPRCSQNFTALKTLREKSSSGLGELSKAIVLQYLVHDCKSWMDTDTGIDELPPLHFHVTGSGGSEQVLELPPWAYIMESEQEEAHFVTEHTFLLDIVTGVKKTGHKQKVCSLAFGPMDYMTSKNGPVWILGTPLFYQFQVAYDLESKPPSISFQSTKEKRCGSCGDTQSLLASSPDSDGSVRRMRQMTGPLRMPTYDTSLPL